MLLDGILKLGRFGVKTRPGNNVEIGLHLLYSSSNRMTPSLESYPQFRYSEQYPTPALVGVGEVKEVRHQYVYPLH